MHDNRRDKTPTTTSVTSSTFLKMELHLVVSKLYGTQLDAASVKRLADECQDRFRPDYTWTIDALSIEKVSDDARLPLLKLFMEFQAKNGKRILVGAGKTFVRLPFQIAAKNAGATLRLFQNMSEIAAELNTAAKKT